ncbi:hypothetical protein MC7420_6511 [Coleofasciculus chthonoplastes PCC 7420]|uniref:Uncharacterized protein n=1 Tax=Coleofasciculus chthonoplastes PCC 7420 TaxID=118168 RepID=B4VQW5_9CYAN|nr:hypothetical protein MC7420_6511 [Coleofasciculus chthonoplastes PCC 7420]
MLFGHRKGDREDGGAGEAGEEKINLELIRALLGKMGCTTWS